MLRHLLSRGIEMGSQFWKPPICWGRGLVIYRVEGEWGEGFRDKC